jgi:hypothetical protein
MTWPDVAAIAVVFLGVALLIGATTWMMRSVPPTIRTETSTERLMRQFFERPFQSTNFRYTRTVAEKPTPNPSPLVTPPPKSPPDDLPN